MGALRRVLLAAGLALLAPLATPADPAMVDTLVKQAQYWDQRGRADLARESWRRVLDTDPDHLSALARLAVLEHRTGHDAEAQILLDRLARLAPDSAALREARQGVAAAADAPGGDLLARARALAREGRSADAVRAYQQAFGGGAPPDGPLALEYYETLAGVDGSWAEARDALRRLTEQQPARADYALAYARVLTYQPPTRRDGIARLETLSREASVAADARNALRQALLWLPASRADAPLYQRYLRMAGPDPLIEARLGSLDQTAGRRPARDPAQAAQLESAFAALDANDDAGAEAGFQQVLAANANQPDALAGLGIVRLRQGRFAAAERLLAAALRGDPRMESKYREALKSARYWTRVGEAMAALEAGDLAAARGAYAAAVAAPPLSGAEPAVDRDYAQVLEQSGAVAEAERHLRKALAERPRDATLKQALAATLMRAGRIGEAETLFAELPPEASAEIADLRASVARGKARDLDRAGQIAEAEAELQRALVAAPDNPWLRLDLARLYRKTGRPREADSLLDTLLEAAALRPDGWLAQSYAHAENQDWYATLLALEKLAPELRTPEAAALQREAWVRYQIQRAQLAARRGDAAAAAEWLSAAVAAAGNDPALSSALASGWAALGDPARAVAALRASVRSGAPRSLGDQLQYAGLLLQLDQDGEFEALSSELIRQGLPASALEVLEDLNVGYRIKLADRARVTGDLAEAYRQLRDPLARYPDQERVQLALARLFIDAGEPDQALAIVRSCLARSDDPDAVLLAGVDAALAARDAGQAQEWIDRLFASGREPVATHRAAARLAELRGRQALALEHYEAASVLGRANARSAASPPQLALIDPADPARRPLPVSVRSRLDGAEAPVGPLLPRALGVVPRLSGPGAADEPVPSAPASSGAARPPPPAPGAAPLAPPLVNRIDRSAGGTAQATREPTLLTPSERLRAAVSGRAQAGLMSRNRRGEAGLTRLQDIEFPLDWISPEWGYGRLGLRLKPVLLAAGEVSGPNLLRFGTLALIPDRTEPLNLSESGLGLNFSFRSGGLIADIGTSPLGFPEENLVGGLRWNWANEVLRLKLDASRRSLNDSLLSYAGAYDPLTGKFWGGVSRTGARADLAWDYARYGVYVNGAVYGLDGHNVSENSQIEFGAGLFSRFRPLPNQTLTAGLNLTTFGYEQNLRHFSFGHGGYFSPQFFGALTVPLDWSGRLGALSYRVDAALGVQSFREDGAPLFPGRPGLQQEAEDLAELEPEAGIPLGYAAQNHTGLAYKLGGAAQYQLTDTLAVGGTLSADNAQDYEELNLLAYVRYHFSGPQPVPVEPRPLRVFESPLHE